MKSVGSVPLRAVALLIFAGFFLHCAATTEARKLQSYAYSVTYAAAQATRMLLPMPFPVLQVLAMARGELC